MCVWLSFSCGLVCCADPTKAIHTELSLVPEEFESYQVGVDVDVTFCLKELRVCLCLIAGKIQHEFWVFCFSRVLLSWTVSFRPSWRFQNQQICQCQFTSKVPESKLIVKRAFEEVVSWLFRSQTRFPHSFQTYCVFDWCWSQLRSRLCSCYFGREWYVVSSWEVTTTTQLSNRSAPEQNRRKDLKATSWVTALQVQLSILTLVDFVIVIWHILTAATRKFLSQTQLWNRSRLFFSASGEMVLSRMVTTTCQLVGLHTGNKPVACMADTQNFCFERVPCGWMIEPLSTVPKFACWGDASDTPTQIFVCFQCFRTKRHADGIFQNHDNGCRVERRETLSDSRRGGQNRHNSHTQKNCFVTLRESETRIETRLCPW